MSNEKQELLDDEFMEVANESYRQWTQIDKYKSDLVSFQHGFEQGFKFSKLTPPSVDGELLESLKEILLFVEWVGCESTQEGDERERISTMIKKLIARRDGSAPQEPKEQDDTVCPGCGVKEGRQHQEGCPSNKTDFEEMFKSSKLFKKSEPEQPSEQEELWVEAQELFDYEGYGSVSKKFVIYRRGSEPDVKKNE